MIISVDTIHDPVFVKKSRYNFLQKLLLHLIRDERDLPFIYLCLKITFIVIPVAIYLYIPGQFNWWIASLYLVLNLVIGLGPFVLMLHNTSHRKLFKKEFGLLNYYIPWVLGPFYGESPETYFHHHVAMHHPEENLPPDISSTMKYRRDSIGAFMTYFGRFFFIGIYELTLYFKQRKRTMFLRKVLLGESSFILMCILLSLINWKATLFVFILPFVFVRFGMMAGNWAQHAFIDKNDPGNSYHNSITCINSAYNKKCFNDGYHIGHHLKPAMHWTDMPVDFIKNQNIYASQKAVVFEGVDYFYIWFLLMTKNYNKLASKFVNINHAFPDRDSIIAFLKTRTAKI